MRRIVVGLSVVAAVLGGSSLPAPGAAPTVVDQRLIVRSEGDRAYDETILSAHGRELGRLMVHPAQETALSVSPSGRRFAYVEPEVLAELVPFAPRARPTHARVRPSALVVGDFLRSTAPPGGASVFRLPTATIDRVVGRPAWGPGGERLVVGRRTAAGIHLVVVAAAGRHTPRPLTSGTGQDTNPAWSPTSATVIFERRTGAGTDLYAVSSSGTDLRDLTGWRGEERWPSWSPDGRSVAFASNGSGLFRLYTLDVFSGAIRRVETGVGNATMPRWSPDGHSLAFVSDADGDSDVRVVDLASGAVTSVTHNATEDRLEDWQLVRDTQPPLISVRPSTLGADGRGRLTATIRDTSDWVLVAGSVEVSGGLVNSGFGSIGHLYQRVGHPPLRLDDAVRRAEILSDFGASASEVDLSRVRAKHCVAAVDAWGNTAQRCAVVRFRAG